MRSSIRTALAVLLLIGSIAAPACGQDSATSSEDDEYADEEKAFLIVRKAPLEDDVVVGSNLTVVIDIHNAGSRCATHDAYAHCALMDAAAGIASCQLSCGPSKVYVALRVVPLKRMLRMLRRDCCHVECCHALL